MSDDLDQTKHGCRADNFRALAAAGWTAAEPTYGIVQFWDGSTYRLGPTTEAEWRHKVLQGDDPGCWVNKVLKARADYTYQRLDTFPPRLTSIRVWRD